MYMCTHWFNMYFYLYLCIYLLCIGSSFGLLSWNMSDVCGLEIPLPGPDHAGELYFHADQTPGLVCNVTITPTALQTAYVNMVMFYFTIFELEGSCSDASVTVNDGRLDTDPVVDGLPNYLCGTDITLVEDDRAFTTSGESVRISFSTNNIVQSTGTILALKFVTYYTGKCSEYDSYECSNGHCIPAVYICSDEINACGETDENCTVEEPINILLVIAIVGGILVFFMIACRSKGGKSNAQTEAQTVQEDTEQEDESTSESEQTFDGLSNGQVEHHSSSPHAESTSIPTDPPHYDTLPLKSNYLRVHFQAEESSILNDIMHVRETGNYASDLDNRSDSRNISIISSPRHTEMTPTAPPTGYSPSQLPLDPPPSYYEAMSMPHYPDRNNQTQDIDLYDRAYLFSTDYRPAPAIILD